MAVSDPLNFQYFSRFVDYYDWTQALEVEMLNYSNLHHAIVRYVLERGYAPTCATLAGQFEVTAGEMGKALRALEEYHGVVLHPHHPEIWVVHPFATSATPFVVRQDERIWWANCALCALGLAALLGGDGVTIETTFGAEGRPVTVHVEGGQVRESFWVHFPVPMERAWDNVVYTCSTMLVFESEGDLEGWCERHGMARGDVRPIQLVYKLGEAWYGKHADEYWRKWTIGEAREIFARFKLTGPIWELPESRERF